MTSISGIVIALVIFIHTNRHEICKFFSKNGHYLYPYFAFMNRLFSKHTEYTVTARTCTRNNSLWSTHFPKTWLALNKKVQEYLLQHGHDISCTIHEYQEGQFLQTEREPIVFSQVSGMNQGFSIEKDIKVFTNIETLHGEKDNTYTNLIITIRSTTHDSHVLKRFMDATVKDYENATIEAMKQQHVFIFEKHEVDQDAMIYREIVFNTTKSFDNLFFKDKQKVLKAIDYFNNNKNEFARLGIPHTLGFLFHGEPGCAKTSCIKSIAKYTKRHIVIIPMKRINSFDTLKRIFLEREINGIIIPNEKRLYVFEEIDCGTWGKVVTNREQTQKPADMSFVANVIDAAVPDRDENEIIANLIEHITTKRQNLTCKNKAVTDDINLGDLLELLDGIIEIPGRMVIMTSNHPETLDKALLRPGRIDHVVEFTRMRREDIASMYQLWFHKELPPDVYAGMMNGVFTQAELGNLFSSCDIDYIIKRLTSH